MVKQFTNFKIVSFFFVISILLTACSFHSSNGSNSINESSIHSEVNISNNTSSSGESNNNQYKNKSNNSSLFDNTIENRGAVDVVMKYLEAKKNNDYELKQSTLWTKGNGTILEKKGDLGVLTLEIKDVKLDDNETKRIREMYSGGESAQHNGWDQEFIEENMIAVYAAYFVDYDNTKVANNEGNTTQFFYLVRENKNSNWLIWDQGRISTE